VQRVRTRRNARAAADVDAAQLLAGGEDRARVALDRTADLLRGDVLVGARNPHARGDLVVRRPVDETGGA
jgi:hypothetical protein